MKQLRTSKYLPIFIAALGVFGLILRMVLYAVAVDRKNLLLSGHPLEWLLWLVTAAAFALGIAGVWKRKGSELYADHFAPSAPAAIGAVAAAAGIGVTVFLNWSGVSGTLALVWKITGVLAAAALILVAKFRREGKQPLFLFHCIVCIFFAIHMVSCYQNWSSNPQIQDYVFTLLASVGLMLFSYQQTAFDADAGNARLQTGIGLLTGFSCIVALSGTVYPILYLTGGIWVLTNLCGE